MSNKIQSSRVSSNQLFSNSRKKLHSQLTAFPNQFFLNLSISKIIKIRLRVDYRDRICTLNRLEDLCVLVGEARDKDKQRAIR